MKAAFFLLCALVGFVVAFRPQIERSSLSLRHRINPIRAPSLVLGEKEDDDKAKNDLWVPESVSNLLKGFNLPNILLGTFLGGLGSGPLLAASSVEAIVDTRECCFFRSRFVPTLHETAPFLPTGSAGGENAAPCCKNRTVRATTALTVHS